MQHKTTYETVSAQLSAPMRLAHGRSKNDSMKILLYIPFREWFQIDLRGTTVAGYPAAQMAEAIKTYNDL